MTREALPSLQYDEDDVDLAEVGTRETAHFDRHALKRRGARPQPCMVMVSGRRSVGRLHPIRNGMTLGRSVSSDVVIEESGVSRRHAKFVVGGDGSVTIVDLGSSNGLVSKGQRVTSMTLHEGDRVEIGDAAFVFLEMDGLDETLRENLLESATTDAETRLLVRRHFFEVLDRELAVARKFRVPLSVLVFSIDQYRQFCDEHGGVTMGPVVLRRVAAMIEGCIQSEDLAIGRLAEDELALILPETSAEDAARAAEWVRAAAHSVKLPNESDAVSFTVSGGTCTTTGEDVASAADLVHQAEKGLYRARIEGGNRVGAHD